MPQLCSRFLVIAAISLGASCQSSGDDHDREECNRLVDHLVDMQLGDGDQADPAHAAEHDKHRRILRDAIRDRVIAECLKRPADHTKCALRAATSADLEECN